VRLRNIRDGLGFRIYQVRKPENRHLVDVRPVLDFPPHQKIQNVQVVTPPELIAGKVAAWVRRKDKPKSGTDWRDLAQLLLTFPELKQVAGPVRERLEAMGVAANVHVAWENIVSQEIEAESDEDEFDY
jgi:Nucleotidyl transferase AbiEii toxin, Type IV TA system